MAQKKPTPGTKVYDSSKGMQVYTPFNGRKAQPEYPEALVTALRAIMEATWRLDTIVDRLPESSYAGEGDFSRMPEILKDHGRTCLTAIYNAMETITDTVGIKVSQDKDGEINKAFETLKEGPVTA